MKTTSTLVMLAAALALVGCDGSKNSYTRSADDPASPEVKKEAREGLNAPKDADLGNKFVRGQDIPEPRVADKNDPLPVITPELQRDLKDIVKDTTYAADNVRDQFVASTEEKMSELSEGITALGEKVEALNADSYAKDTMSSLREKHEQVEKLFADIKAATRESWMELKPAFDTALSDLDRAFDEAKSKYDGN